MNINIFNFLNQNFPDFNPENEQDLIRAEKILNVESKINGTFTKPEIEDFLFKIKSGGKKFADLLKTPAIEKILSGNIPDENDEIPDFRSFPIELLDDFSEYCSTQVSEILQKNVADNQWKKLDFFMINYLPILNFINEDEIFEMLYQKNQQLIRYVTEFTDLVKFKKQFPFCVDENYYELLSTVNAYGFGNQMMRFTTVISERQNTHEKNKAVLGEIVTAMSSFQAFYEEQKKLLESNRKIGEEWSKERNSFLGKFANSISKFILNENHFALSLLLSFFILIFIGIVLFFINSLGFPKLLTFVFIFLLVVPFSFGTINENLKLFKKEFFPYYFIKFSGTIFILMCVAVPIFLVLAVVFEMTFSFENKTNFGGALVFPIVYFLIRFFNQKK